MPTIQLQSSDGKIFDVEVEIAKASNTIKTIIEDMGLDADDDPIPLLDVNGFILRKVIEWATHHKDDPPPPEDDDNKEKRTDDIEPWDQEFLKVDQGTFFELIIAAKYLDIKGLLDVTCKTLANMIKGKTPDEIRQTFNVKNDFTPEEAEQIRKENGWD